ncbi:MAG TPA: alpha-amylase family glycosyl hydrolase, partial [Terriglobales bacterium]|nr:alpha-amylase family glycosyl hydrolase [Terriglobales bacterium]
MAVRAVSIPFPPRPRRVPVSPLLTLPAPNAAKVELRFAPLDDRDDFGRAWQFQSLKSQIPGIFQIDLNSLGLPDGTYEYDFVVSASPAQVIADPFAEELEKFGGYRSVFHIENGIRVAHEFDWSDELSNGVPLPNNNQMVVYEMPVRWMSQTEENRQVDIGTFERTVFEHLDDLHDLGINAIELLPIEDSADTIDWGYGTRFFFAPDWDMGTPIDLKFLVKCCHQYGIRVILDVVMNHSRKCPLETLADNWYYLAPGSTEEDGNGVHREDYGGRLFKYARPVDGGQYAAREFHYRMAEFWIREYRVDGFRIDEFKGINNWDFLQGFRQHAWAEHDRLFSDRPFIVIAEDSWRRPEITRDDAYHEAPLVDSMWNFDFRDEIRRLLDNALTTNLGEPSRSDRIYSMISAQKVWNDMSRSYRSEGFDDLRKTVNYITSHDVEKKLEERLMNFHLSEILAWMGKTPGQGQTQAAFIKSIVDNIASQPADVQAAHAQALERIGSSFALMLTSVGVPMFLAGEEFADIHDLDNTDWHLKMSDPVDWSRLEILGHKTLRNRVRELIRLRTQHPALQRNEVNFFYWHPSIDQNDGVRVFAYCRSGGQDLGKSGQAVV